jgi:hypothetical protein
MFESNKLKNFFMQMQSRCHLSKELVWKELDFRVGNYLL